MPSINNFLNADNGTTVNSPTNYTPAPSGESIWFRYLIGSCGIIATVTGLYLCSDKIYSRYKKRADRNVGNAARCNQQGRSRAAAAPVAAAASVMIPMHLVNANVAPIVQHAPTMQQTPPQASVPEVVSAAQRVLTAPDSPIMATVEQVTHPVSQTDVARDPTQISEEHNPSLSAGMAGPKQPLVNHGPQLVNETGSINSKLAQNDKSAPIATQDVKVLGKRSSDAGVVNDASDNVDTASTNDKADEQEFMVSAISS